MYGRLIEKERRNPMGPPSLDVIVACHAMAIVRFCLCRSILGAYLPSTSLTCLALQLLPLTVFSLSVESERVRYAYIHIEILNQVVIVVVSGLAERCMKMDNVTALTV